MRFRVKERVIGAGLIALVLVVSSSSGTQAADNGQIGMFATIQGTVLVAHAGSSERVAAQLRGPVLFKDVIETQAQSRTKALFQDDSILTIGENSKIEITEHIFDPNQNQRTMVVNLVQGKVRALVGKVFSGFGSKFEVHTSTAVAAARGTYFVVWIEEGATGPVGGLDEPGTVRPVSLTAMDVAQLTPGSTGVANIGSTGNVSFSSGGQTVTLPPGQFSLAPPGAPPAPPVVISGGGGGGSTPASVNNAVKGTEVKDSSKTESPKQTTQATGGSAPVAPPAGPPGAVTGVTPTTSSSSSSSSSSSTTTTTTNVTTTTVTAPIAPPAVTSGAANSTNTSIAPPNTNTTPSTKSTVTITIR